MAIVLVVVEFVPVLSKHVNMLTTFAMFTHTAHISPLTYIEKRSTKNLIPLNSANIDSGIKVVACRNGSISTKTMDLWSVFSDM